MSDYENPEEHSCACGNPAWARIEGQWVCFGYGLAYLSAKDNPRQLHILHLTGHPVIGNFAAELEQTRRFNPVGRKAGYETPPVHRSGRRGGTLSLYDVVTRMKCRNRRRRAKTKRVGALA